MSKPEFSRMYRLDTIGEGARAVAIAAEPGERAALAERFGLIALDRLEAEASLRRAGTIVHVDGALRADAVQPCVATGDPVPAALDVPFTLRFVPEADLASADEIELSEEDCDAIPYVSGAIDLGEAVAETLSLALDPFPRSAHADAALRAAGVVREEDHAPASPFGALKGLFPKAE